MLWGTRDEPAETWDQLKLPEGPSSDFLNFPHYNTKILAIFPPFLNIWCTYSHVSWLHVPWNVPTYTGNDEVYPCLCMISPDKDGFDALFGDTLVWEGPLVWPCLLAHNRVPSHTIVLELSLAATTEHSDPVRSPNSWSSHMYTHSHVQKCLTCLLQGRNVFGFQKEFRLKS